MVSTSGSSAACSMKRCTEPANDSYGWWTSRSPARMAAKTSTSSSSSAGTRRGGRDRLPGRRLQVRDVEVRDRSSSARQVEHARDLVDVASARGPGRCWSSARVAWRHRALHLEAHDLAEASLAQLLLDGQQQVVRLVLLDREVGVARDPEQVVLEDLHAREQDVQVGRDDLLQQHVGARAHLPQPGQHRRHLDAREASLAGRPGRAP